MRRLVCGGGDPAGGGGGMMRHDGGDDHGGGTGGCGWGSARWVIRLVVWLRVVSGLLADQQPDGDPPAGLLLGVGGWDIA